MRRVNTSLVILMTCTLMAMPLGFPEAESAGGNGLKIKIDGVERNVIWTEDGWLIDSKPYGPSGDDICSKYPGLCVKKLSESLTLADDIGPGGGCK